MRRLAVWPANVLAMTYPAGVAPRCRGLARRLREADIRITLTLPDNRLLPVVFGVGNVNLDRLERVLGVRLASMGNEVVIEGDERQAILARQALEVLYEGARDDGADIGFAEVDLAARMRGTNVLDDDLDIPAIRTRKKSIVPRNAKQAEYLRLMRDSELTIALGPAGTGKTYLAVCMAVSLKLIGTVDRIILCRPVVEAGERLGFLPGDIKEKVDPYLRPLYDSLYDCLPAEAVHKALVSDEIEVAPLAFMRGRTLKDAFVIVDEAQNTTPTQMKMVLTRLGQGSRMVISGDLSQVDLPACVTSGLRDALEVIQGIAGVGIVSFSSEEVLRHDLVARIVSAYSDRGRQGSVAAPLSDKETASDDV